MTTLTNSRPYASEPRGFGSGWGWFVALGIALIGLGALAYYNLPAATMASVYAVGIFMVVAGVMQLFGSIAARTRSGFAFMLLSAILYCAAGVLTLVNPLLAASVLTLMLAFALIFSGVTRIAWSFALRGERGWGWITASGVISIVAGVVFIAGWPADTLYLLGVVLAVDLAFQGAMLVGLGIALKDIVKS